MAVQERALRTRASLLDAAHRLIAEKGTQETTFEALSTASGASRGSIRFHFGSKNGLLFAVIDRAFAQWEQGVLAPLLPPAGPTSFDDAIAANRRFVEEDPETLRVFLVLLSDALGPRPELLPHYVTLQRRFRDFITEWVGAAQRNGTVDAGIDPRVASFIVLGALEGLMLQWQIDPDDVPIERVYETLTRVFDSGFAPKN